MKVFIFNLSLNCFSLYFAARCSFCSSVFSDTKVYLHLSHFKYQRVRFFAFILPPLSTSLEQDGHLSSSLYSVFPLRIVIMSNLWLSPSGGLTFPTPDRAFVNNRRTCRCFVLSNLRISSSEGLTFVYYAPATCHPFWWGCAPRAYVSFLRIDGISYYHTNGFKRFAVVF